jgi:hypothetical protein
MENKNNKVSKYASQAYIDAAFSLKVFNKLNKEHTDGCRYGQPDGPDDYIKDCECED